MDSSDDFLTKADCYIILKNYSKNDNIILKSYETNKLSSVEGLLGQHYKLKIICDEDSVKKEINLFLKIAAAPFRAVNYIVESIKAYEKEEFYFNYLLKQFRVCGISSALAPKFYYCRKPLLVFEDLTLRGYKNAPMKDMLDMRHCKIGLKTLAKFHASTIIYEKIQSNSDNAYTDLQKMYPNLLEDVLYSERKNAATEWIECTFKGVLALIDLLPKCDISAEAYKSKLIEIFQASKNVTESSKNCISTLLHGDLWSNNFMFKYENGIPVDSILIDYQILKYGPISLDINHMIITNVRRNVRSDHYEELLSYYYHQFAEICDAHGFDAHSFVSYIDFMDSCEETKTLAKIGCLADHSITFLIESFAEEAMLSEESLHEFILGDRSRSMILSFKTDDVYREIMSEDLIELRDLLFENK